MATTIRTGQPIEDHAGHRRAPFASGRASPAAVGLALLAVGAGAVLGLTALRDRGPRMPDSAPGRSARGIPRFGRHTVVGRTVTIGKPRGELYAFWRDFSNLPRFMENVESVREAAPGRTAWTVRAPGGRTVEVVTEVVEEREGELIAWRSVEASDIETQGRVAFRDAPGGRGTRVEAIIAYRPPAGELGRMAAKVFQREPAVQTRRELKRFKMLMESGEVATSQMRRDQP